jgi:2',3'-cyclic-nucleotide 2'-phosphodiesterase/3'-nucleotidase/5'-nucleotidase
VEDSLMKKLVIAVVASLAAVATLPATPGLSLTPIGTLKTGPFRAEDPRAAEINAFDPVARRIFAINPLNGRLDIIDASDPAAPVAAGLVDIVAECQAAMGISCPVLPGSEPNSVAIHDDLMAIAVANAVRTDNGHAVFFSLNGLAAPQFVAAVEVGALPDMITFDEDGKFVLTANEGEPNPSYTIDPPGSVSVIEVARLGSPGAAVTIGFDRFDEPDARAKIEAEGVRIFGPGATVAQDLEPEYIAVRGNKAYVTLQENNALAIVNIAGGTVEKIVGLGLKDHALAGDALDASDQDGINIRNWPVRGMYQPDAIQSLQSKGRTYLIMANEGDAREYLGEPGYVEALRLNNSGYVLDPVVFPNAALLKANNALGRLNVSRASGDLDGDGDYDRIDVFGGRSVSIRDHTGRLVWDSGEMFERLSQFFDGTLTLFNTTNSANSRDNRSDDKGIEPESVVVGSVGGRQYAFVGLERDSGIVVLDVTEPESPVYVTYANRRKFPRNAAGNLLACNDVNDCGDLGPEGLTFVPADKSPIGAPLLIVSNEVSGTTTVWRVQ